MAHVDEGGGGPIERDRDRGDFLAQTGAHAAHTRSGVKQLTLVRTLPPMGGAASGNTNRLKLRPTREFDNHHGAGPCPSERARARAELVGRRATGRRREAQRKAGDEGRGPRASPFTLLLPLLLLLLLSLLLFSTPMSAMARTWGLAARWPSSLDGAGASTAKGNGNDKGGASWRGGPSTATCRRPLWPSGAPARQRRRVLPSRSPLLPICARLLAAGAG